MASTTWASPASKVMKRGVAGPFGGFGGGFPQDISFNIPPAGPWLAPPPVFIGPPPGFGSSVR